MPGVEVGSAEAKILVTRNYAVFCGRIGARWVAADRVRKERFLLVDTVTEEELGTAVVSAGNPGWYFTPIRYPLQAACHPTLAEVLTDVNTQWKAAGHGIPRKEVEDGEKE